MALGLDSPDIPMIFSDSYTISFFWILHWDPNGPFFRSMSYNIPFLSRNFPISQYPWLGVPNPIGPGLLENHSDLVNDEKIPADFNEESGLTSYVNLREDGYISSVCS